MKTKLLTMFATLAMLVTGSANAQSFYWYVGTTMPDAVDPSTWEVSSTDAGFTATINIADGDNYLVIPNDWVYTAIEPSTNLPFEWNSWVKPADKVKIPGYTIKKAGNMVATEVEVTFSKAEGYYWYSGSMMQYGVDVNSWGCSTTDAEFTADMTIYEGNNYLIIPDSWDYTMVESSTGLPFDWKPFIIEEDKTTISGYVIVKVSDMTSGYVRITFTKKEENPTPETTYYWYVGTTEPTELNGAVANAETDKWVEIGTEMPSYINVETANKYDYWYVLMPTEFDFCPHNGDGSIDESVIWTSTTSSIPGYTLWSRNDKALKLATIFKKLGELPYNANSDYWYLGHIDPTTMTEINPINVNNIFFTEGGSWEELIDPSAMIELIVTPKDWDSESMKSLWYVAMPASSGYTPQDADLWETSTATIAGKDYIVYKSEGKVWKLNTAFLPEGYVEENPEPEPEPTPEPASVAFTFTRDADVAVNVEGIEGVTASIEAAPATYLTTAAAANDSILCINQNTSTATADNPNKYTLTITNNSGVNLAFDYINVCGVALNSTGNFQGVRTVRDRVFVVSYGDNTLAPATMRICDDSHCSGVATVNTFEAADAIPASSTYVIGVSIYTDGGAGCFYGLTRITLGKNEPEGGDVTDIESPVLEAQDSQLIYDLQGRRVTHPTKGIYIVGGKKVIMK